MEHKACTYWDTEEENWTSEAAFISPRKLEAHILLVLSKSNTEAIVKCW